MKLEMDKTKWTNLEQRTCVSFTQKTPEGMTAAVDPFTITASPSGISFKGSMVGELSNEAELQAFAKLFSDIWVERKRLRPAIVTSPSGH